jgi:hypothetical protein
MIHVKENGSKRATICGVDYVMNNHATVKDFPGSMITVLVTEWVPIRFSSISFTENDEVNGEFVSQELTINVKGIDNDTEQNLRDIAGQGVLVRLKYTNGVYKIVGTEENPVVLSLSSEGSPVNQSLVSKRNSAEKAKYLNL